jgi:hypothetical protein
VLDRGTLPFFDLALDHGDRIARSIRLIIPGGPGEATVFEAVIHHRRGHAASKSGKQSNARWIAPEQFLMTKKMCKLLI